MFMMKIKICFFGRCNNKKCEDVMRTFKTHNTKKSKKSKKSQRTQHRTHKRTKKQCGGWQRTDPHFQELTSSIANINDFKDVLMNGLTTRYAKILTNEETENIMQMKREQIIDMLMRTNEQNDDLNYLLPKFSIIPEGTTFYRRQTTNEFNQTELPVWLDYTATFSPNHISFLKDTSEKYTEAHLIATKQKFGEHLLVLKTTKPLLIFHIPHNIPSFYESYVRYLFLVIQEKTIFGEVDGYTMDFLTFNPNVIYRDLQSVGGFRELCVFQSKNLVKIDGERESTVTTIKPQTTGFFPSFKKTNKIHIGGNKTKKQKSSQKSC